MRSNFASKMNVTLCKHLDEIRLVQSEQNNVTDWWGEEKKELHQKMRVVQNPNTDLNSILEAQQKDIQMLKMKLDETNLYHNTAMSNLRRESKQLIAHSQMDEKKSRKKDEGLLHRPTKNH